MVQNFSVTSRNLVPVRQAHLFEPPPIRGSANFTRHKWLHFGPPPNGGVYKQQFLNFHAPPGVSIEDAFDQWFDRIFSKTDLLTPESEEVLSVAPKRFKRSLSLIARFITRVVSNQTLRDAHVGNSGGKLDNWNKASFSVLLDKCWARASELLSGLQKLKTKNGIRTLSGRARIGARVLVVDPFCRHCTGELLDSLAEVGRGFGINMHALVTADNIREMAPSWQALQRMQKLYHRVAIYGCTPGTTCDISRLWRSNNEVAREIGAFSGGREQAFDAVITWNGFHTALADDLGLQLGSGNRYTGKFHLTEAHKTWVRNTLNRHKTSGSVGATEVRSKLEAIAAANDSMICYPCHLKPAVSIGMSAGQTPHLLSGRIDDLKQMDAAYTRISGHLRSVQPLLLERFLSGPEIFAEVIVRRASVLRVSFRALKIPSTPTQRSATWQWPAVLTKQQRRSCTRTVRQTIRTLDLQTGVFGLQLVLDDAVEGGCAMLEANLRPHMWPLLHDKAFQVFFSEVWPYAEVALLLATHAPLNDIFKVLAKPDARRLVPPLQLTVVCTGKAADHQLLYLEWLILLVEGGSCQAEVLPTPSYSIEAKPSERKSKLREN